MARFGIATVRGRSMQPTLWDGDRLVVRYVDHARPGDLVLVRLPHRPLSVKRLVRREPEGGWWVERDNPHEGVDSWQIGAVPAGDLVAVVVTRLRVLNSVARWRRRTRARRPA
ncbi:S24/S26 family peptidase [Actinopolymorpha pittospori]